MTYLANRWDDRNLWYWQIRYSTYCKCNFSSLRSFNNIFFFLPYRLQYIIHITHKMHVSWLFMLSVRLPVKFLVSQKLQADFQLHRWLAPTCCSRVTHKQKIIVEIVNRFLALGLSSCRCLCRPGSPSRVSGLLGISWGPIIEHDCGEAFSETWLDLIWCRFFFPESHKSTSSHVTLFQLHVQPSDSFAYLDMSNCNIRDFHKVHGVGGGGIFILKLLMRRQPHTVSSLRSLEITPCSITLLYLKGSDLCSQW